METTGSTQQLTPWSIVVLPDTQVYAAKHPEHFDRQVDFVLRHARKHPIAAVLHEGDVVDDNSDAQWELASRALRRLEGHVPLVMALGNHDYGKGGSGGDRTTGLHRWFPAESFETVVSTFEPDRVDNALHRIRTPEGTWHVLVLEFAPRAEAVAWGRAQLEQTDAPAIVLTHTYLYSDHTRYDRTRDDQRWAPWVYGVARRDGACDGETIFRQLVEPCSQVQLVLCGHVLNEGTGCRTDTRTDGSRVHQVLANYQTRDEGGESYLRLMTFTETTIEVRSYSPWLDAELTDSRNRFVLPRS